MTGGGGWFSSTQTPSRPVRVTSKRPRVDGSLECRRDEKVAVSKTSLSGL